MPEESGKAASQVLGAIPNVYFDLIARVIPGCFFIFALNRTIPKNTLSSVFDVFIPYQELHDSTTAWLLVLVTTAYVLGHFLSPFVRYLEEGPHWTEALRDSTEQVRGLRKICYCGLPPFWTCTNASADSLKNLHNKYNHLRCQDPTLAALAIRIRAEYTMYGGFAVALMVTLLVAFIETTKTVVEQSFMTLVHRTTMESWLILIAAVIAIPVMLFRHLHTWNRFSKTVDQLLTALDSTKLGAG